MQVYGARALPSASLYSTCKSRIPELLDKAHLCGEVVLSAVKRLIQARQHLPRVRLLHKKDRMYVQ